MYLYSKCDLIMALSGLETALTIVLSLIPVIGAIVGLVFKILNLKGKVGEDTELQSAIVIFLRHLQEALADKVLSAEEITQIVMDIKTMVSTIVGFKGVEEAQEIDFLSNRILGELQLERIDWTTSLVVAKQSHRLLAKANPSTFSKMKGTVVEKVASVFKKEEPLTEEIVELPSEVIPEELV